MPRKFIAKKSLSQGVLGMKFMQRSKDLRDQEEERKESQAVLSKNIPKNLKSTGVEVKVIESYIELEGLTCGRVSFKGMNPHVERIMKAEEDARVSTFLEEERQRSNIPEISDEKMASVLSKNMQSRFNTKKRNREISEQTSPVESSSEESDASSLEEPVKKPKFLKPKDDDDD